MLRSIKQSAIQQGHIQCTHGLLTTYTALRIAQYLFGQQCTTICLSRPCSVTFGFVCLGLKYMLLWGYVKEGYAITKDDCKKRMTIY